VKLRYKVVMYEPTLPIRYIVFDKHLNKRAKGTGIYKTYFAAKLSSLRKNKVFNNYGRTLQYLTKSHI